MNSQIDELYKQFWDFQSQVTAVKIQQAAHEATCTQRYEQITEELGKMNTLLTLLIVQKNQREGAIKLAKFVWLGLGALAASVVWAMKIMGMRVG